MYSIQDADNWLHSAFALLQDLPGFRVRQSQKDLAFGLFHAYVSSTPYIAEAPTGTGKTIAYLLGARAAQLVTGLPIVVATANVGLQSQILTSDLPTLAEIGAVFMDQVVLAKGRNRYFCPAQAKAQATTERQMDMLQTAEKNTLGMESAELLRQFESGKWDGDSDKLKSKPVFWAKIGASNETCTNSSCDHFSTDCPFYGSRKKISKVNKEVGAIIVANQDLVIMDALAQGGDSTPLSLSQYYLVIDEAHHFPSKLLEHHRNEGAFWTLVKRMGEIPKAFKGIEGLKNRKISDALRRANAIVGPQETGPLRTNVLTLQKAFTANGPEAGTDYFRLSSARCGPLSDDLRKLIEQTIQQATSICVQLEKANSILKKTKTDSTIASLVLDYAREAGKGADMLSASLISPLNAVLQSTTGTSDWLAWIEFETDDKGQCQAQRIIGSPVYPTQVMQKYIWDNPALTVAMVSATLTDFSDGKSDADAFNLFRKMSGAPDSSVFKVLPTVFDYTKSVFHLPPLPLSPISGSMSGYYAQTVQWLKEHVNPEEATLVLFTSRASMEYAYRQLHATWESLLVQDMDLDYGSMLAAHRRRVDEGKGGVLFGLKKMSEGLSLEGKYLTHVVIAQLPFPRPGDALTQERQDRALDMGDDFFQQVSLPAMLTDLKQMMGRLNRKETDEGRVTLLDNRLHNKSYAKRILQALPDFNRQFEHQVDWSFRAKSPTSTENA